MAVYYLDSSALVKRYVRESGSVWIESLFIPGAGHIVFIAAITAVEVAAAIARRARGGTILPADAAAACAQFRADLSVDYQIVDLTSLVRSHAMLVAETHGLRAYDAVQLASALAVHQERSTAGLPTLTFVSADTELNGVAAAEGLTVDDPNTH